MIKVICDKCGADCDLNAYVLTVEVIHNPSPSCPLDRGRMKITDDGSCMRMCLCQKCYRKIVPRCPHYEKEECVEDNKNIEGARIRR